jgi:hypothetical protein
MDAKLLHGRRGRQVAAREEISVPRSLGRERRKQRGPRWGRRPRRLEKLSVGKARRRILLLVHVGKMQRAGIAE